ncbi:hypothetical protein PORCAN_622 [Porphyromonas crevioricanis JCM 13913]|nr:hypothetical protein PORCAN_622 [Porphyromonas crevioricanis JCM 13913]
MVPPVVKKNHNWSSITPARENKTEQQQMAFSYYDKRTIKRESTPNKNLPTSVLKKAITKR